MKNLYIVANWKSNLTALEARKWFQEVSSSKLQISNEKTIIICPPFTLLPYTQHNIQVSSLSWRVGGQNISPFDEGAYTGEINGKQIKEFADYVIIGHSERRKNFNESDEILFQKVELANKHGLTPIFCVQGKETQIPPGVAMIAYEPVNAIGTGNPDTAENAEKVTAFFKEKYNIQHALYGGSVTSKNVKGFTQMQSIDGVLIGGASLDAQEFYAIIQNS